MYKHTTLKIETEDQRRAAKTQRSDESENARERVLALAKEDLESGPAAKGTRESNNLTSQRQVEENERII